MFRGNRQMLLRDLLVRQPKHHHCEFKVPTTLKSTDITSSITTGVSPSGIFPFFQVA